MVSFHQKSGTGKLNGVQKKYSTSKYGYIAKVEPAVFLIDDEYWEVRSMLAWIDTI